MDIIYFKLYYVLVLVVISVSKLETLGEWVNGKLKHYYLSNQVVETQGLAIEEVDISYRVRYTKHSKRFTLIEYNTDKGIIRQGVDSDMKLTAGNRVTIIYSKIHPTFFKVKLDKDNQEFLDSLNPINMISNLSYSKIKIPLTYLIVSTFVLLFYPTSARNQEKPSLVGNWIKVNISYLDGLPVEEHHPLKYSFLKYSFKPGKKAAIITDFLTEGNFSPYEEKNGTIEISTNIGAKVKLRLAYLTQDSLVVIQEGRLGRNDPSSFSMTFVRYEHLQKISKWSTQDYVHSPSSDTIYKASQKIHPMFSNSNGFDSALQKNMKPYGKYMRFSGKSNELFFATFIVRKSGVVNNIRIIQGLDDKFNKEFVAACKKTEKKWIPAYYNNEPVDSQVTIEISFDFLNQFLSDQTYSQYAVRRLEKGDIEGAIICFDKMLSLNPKNEKALIFRGQCYLQLNDQESACEDFRILKNLGFASGETLLKKYCK